MTLLSGATAAHDNSLGIAKKIMAHFLNQAESEIACALLTGEFADAAVVKCTYATQRYIVKLFNDYEFAANEIFWTQNASELQIGSKVYYVEPRSRYMILEYVAGSFLVPATANTPEIIKSIAHNLHILHNTPATHGVPVGVWERIKLKYKALECSGPLKEKLDTLFKDIIILEKYLEDLNVRTVPCHNDLNPGNIFIHNGIATFIDWGDSGLGNPYYDIAAFFVLNVITPQNEALFLTEYDPALLTPWWQKNMYLYKQVVYFEFALNLLRGVKASNAGLLHTSEVIPHQDSTYYLTLLAQQEVTIDAAFLYAMANASLDQIDFNPQG